MNVIEQMEAAAAAQTGGAMQTALAALKQIRYLATAEGHASHRRAAKNRDGKEVKTVADALHYQLGSDRVAIDNAIRLLEAAAKLEGGAR